MLNILYISYWGVEDGLTVSTVFPNLELLVSKPNVNHITFCSIERGGGLFSYKGPMHSKIEHVPLCSANIKPAILNKINDFLIFPKQLIALCKERKINYIIARAAPAGSLAHKVHAQTGIPYIVESFEPHADYMLESGVWSGWNPKYLFEKKWEEEQKQTAEALVVVAHNYKKQLIKEGLKEENLFVVPCCVNLDTFRFNEMKRQHVRQQLGYNNDNVVAIYVGKFGDIYYREEAFQLIKRAIDYFGESFRMIILTPQTVEEVEELALAASVPLRYLHVTKVPHHQVPDYLSAADFAFSFVKPANCRLFCSPIKDGEYWANGLPIMMAEMVGDDSEITQSENAGVVYNLETDNLNECFKWMQNFLSKSDRATRSLQIAKVAEKHRNFSIANEVYRTLFDNL